MLASRLWHSRSGISDLSGQCFLRRQTWLFLGIIESHPIVGNLALPGTANAFPKRGLQALSSLDQRDKTRLRAVAMNSKGRIIRDGAVAGLLGAATVAVWFLLFDFSRGSPF